VYWLRRSSAASAVAAIVLAGCYDLDKLRMVDGAVDCGSAILCDDFEAGALDAATWTVNQENGAVTIEDAQAHSGSRSLHVHLDGRPSGVLGRATIETSKPFPLPALYARVYLRAQSINGDYNVLTVVHGASDFEDGVAVWRDDTFAQIGLNVFTSDNRGDARPGIGKSPIDAWRCLAWEVTNLDGANGDTGVARVWVDGVMSIELATPYAQARAVDLFLIGARSPNDTNQVDFWIDDIAVGPEPIGCP
jgi:hypothetical protein